MKFDSIPLVAVIRQKKAGDTRAFFVLLGVVSAFLAAMFFSPAIQQVMMKKMHLRNSSFSQWSVLQFVPSMYNFSNELRIEPDGFSAQLNHYPLREITFNPLLRQFLAESGKPFSVTVRSSYRGTQLTSHFDLISQPPVLILKNVSDDQ